MGAYSSSIRYGGEGKAALRATFTDGAASTRTDGSHVAASRATVRPHGNCESRIIEVKYLG